MKLSGDILEIYNLFHSAGYKLHVVGGAVRDHLLGKDSNDVDLVTDATPDQVETVLAGQTISGAKVRFDFTGRSFGVMRIFNGPGYEIATFRKDITVGRRPEVEIGATIEEDSMRRDFTCNALYWNITEGKVIDLVGGVKDIENKVLMTPGNPKDRFNEDRLRIFRAIRFASRFGWKLDDRIAAAIRVDNSMLGPDANGKLIPISQERIYDEFQKGIAQAKNITNYVEFMNAFCLLRHVFHLQAIPGITEKYIHTYSGKNIIFGNYEPDQVDQVATMILYLAGSLREIPNDIIDHLVRVCKFPRKVAVNVNFLLNLATTDLSKEPEWILLQSAKRKTELNDIEIINFFSNPIFSDKIPIMLALLLYSPSYVNGQMLKEQGFTGKAIGEELKRIQIEKLNQLKKSVTCLTNS